MSFRGKSNSSTPRESTLPQKSNPREPKLDSEEQPKQPPADQPEDESEALEAGALPPELLQSIPEGAAVQLRVQWHAPLPPPQVLAQYNNAVPNGADRILTMAEGAATHTQGMERDSLRYTFYLAAMVLLIAFVLILVGRDVEGFATVLGTMGVLGSLFAVSRVQQSRQRRRLQRAGDGGSQ
jgi:uncharacterized membrane protein